MRTHISCKEREIITSYTRRSFFVFFAISSNSRFNEFHLCDSSFRFNFAFDDGLPALGIAAIPKGAGTLPSHSSAKNNNKNVRMRG